MPRLTARAIFFIALCALSTWSTAQNVYKCGNSYSQSPCPGGAVIDVTDQRTSAQKNQTDQASSRDAKTADSMEKARLRQEKADRVANRAQLPPTKTVIVNRNESPKAKKKKKLPEFFTAQAPGEKKKTTPSAKKTTSKTVK